MYHNKLLHTQNTKRNGQEEILGIKRHHGTHQLGCRYIEAPTQSYLIRKRIKINNCRVENLQRVGMSGEGWWTWTKQISLPGNLCNAHWISATAFSIDLLTATCTVSPPSGWLVTSGMTRELEEERSKPRRKSPDGEKPERESLVRWERCGWIGLRSSINGEPRKLGWLNWMEGLSHVNTKLSLSSSDWNSFKKLKEYRVAEIAFLQKWSFDELTSADWLRPAALLIKRNAEEEEE